MKEIRLNIYNSKIHDCIKALAAVKDETMYNVTEEILYKSLSEMMPEFKTYLTEDNFELLVSEVKHVRMEDGTEKTEVKNMPIVIENENYVRKKEKP